MITINKCILCLALGAFLSACSGNYKSSDGQYRPIGQPPVVIDNNAK